MHFYAILGWLGSKIHLKDLSFSFSFFYPYLLVSAIFNAKFLLSSAKTFSPEGRTTSKVLKIIIFDLEFEYYTPLTFKVEGLLS